MSAEPVFHDHPDAPQTASIAGDPLFDEAAVTEGPDAPQGPETPYVLTLGAGFVGDISTQGDRDWVAVTLEAGKSYDFRMTGVTLSDGVLRLYDGDGVLLLTDDDSGDGLDPLIRTFTAETGGTYYLSAASYADVFTGTYSLSMEEVIPPPPLTEWTVDQVAFQLTDTYWIETGRAPRAFALDPGEAITVNLTALNGDGQMLARLALSAWTWSTGLSFVETSEGADITFDDGQDGAYASMDVENGVITGAWINIGTSWLSAYGTSLDSYSFQTYVHEIGHALGLGHAGGYNGSAIWGEDNDYLNDSWQMSVMSYFSQIENTWVDASYAYLITPMIADVAAIEDLYGIPVDLRLGKTTYGDNSTAGGILDDLSGLSHPVAFTIVDHGGQDRLDASGGTVAQTLDLREGASSDLWGLIGNVTVAIGTRLEVGVGGQGDDMIYGTGYDNRLIGMGGTDTISGFAGDDELRGRAGADLLNGHRGDDLLKGNGGDDVLNGYADNDVLKGGSGSDALNGGAGVDVLCGGAGNDRLSGGADDDLLKGAGGDDRLIGGEGADVFLFRSGHGSDVIVDFEIGVDRVWIDDGGLSASDLSFSDENGGTAVAFADVSVLLKGILAEDLGADDFILT